MIAGKCPSCKKQVMSLRLHGTEVSEPFTQNAFNSITLCCPSCDTILGAQIDPIAIKSDIIDGILSKLAVPQR